MKFKKTSEDGFTLIEVIVSLILMGFLAVVFCLGVSRVFEGYFFSNDTAKAAMDAQMALSRIEKELSVVYSVSAASGRTIIFYAYRTIDDVTEPQPHQPHTLSLSGDSLLLDGDSLLDNVTGFVLTYYDSYNDGTAHSNWSEDRKIIGISVTIKIEDIETSFTTRVAPRNL